MLNLNSIKRSVRILGSIRMALFSLLLMMILVFWGTLAQAHMGTYLAQKRYFYSFFVWSEFFGLSIPILPGGLFVGGVWFINLLCAFIVRFRWEKRNVGIIISHLGLLILIVGQFLTQWKAQESQMAIEVGQTLNYAEDTNNTEMVFIDTSGSKEDVVVSVPYRIFRKQKNITTPLLPFTVRVVAFFKNAELAMRDEATPPIATEGLGLRVSAKEIPEYRTDDQKNNVTAYVELFRNDQSLGIWLLSSGLEGLQSVDLGDRTYFFALRPKRTYYPFQITLKEFRHDQYMGTAIPKNFSSWIRLVHEEKQQDRDVLIYMNHPLRYDGKTFYQASFGKNNTVSVFQIVANPYWLTPYFSCLMIVFGLLIQFLHHLVKFSRSTA